MFLIRQKHGNLDSIEMLYRQLRFLESTSEKKTNISFFFIYAPDNLKEENIEQILRHVLIEEDYFKEEDVEDVISRGKEYLSARAFERNPNLEASINAIQTEALDKRREGVINIEDTSEMTTPDGISEIKVENIILDEQRKEPENVYKDDENIQHSEQEELTALQEIRKGVPAIEISKGKEMIKFFLNKAKELKKKIGKFFGGGDNHDDR